MIESTDTTSPTASAPASAPPPSPVEAGPLTALSIAEKLQAGMLTTKEAGSLARAGNIDMMAVAQAHSILANAKAEPKAPDTRSPAEKQLDAHFPAAKPEEFTIRYGDPSQETTMTPDLKQFDDSARTWLSSAGLPREIGNSLVNEIDRVVQRTHRMTEAQLEEYGVAEFSKLQRVYGDKLEDKLNQAGRMIADLDLKRPGLKNLLRSKGIGDSALVASMLIQHSEIYHQKRKP